MIDRNVRRQASNESITLTNGNNVTVASADGFITVKRPKAKKSPLRKINSLLLE
jgi:hypothetical protein